MIFNCRINRLLKRYTKKTTAKELNELLKKIVMYMTLGVDVSSLFMDVVLISQFPDPLAKKMIYHYLSTYAEVNPELSFMAVNTFVRDCDHPDPKVRALALRSLTALKSQLTSPQVKTQIITSLQDKSPQVQTAAVYGCLRIQLVEKHFFEEHGLYDAFYNLIKASHIPLAMAAINALNEAMSEDGGMAVNIKIIAYLLSQLKSFPDHGQAMIVELCLKYTPKDEEEKLRILNNFDSRLRSASPHLVLLIAKLFLTLTADKDSMKGDVLLRLKQPLLTLLTGASSEMKFNIFHHIYELLKIGAADAFRQDYKRFYCDGDDKSYIQDIKLKILSQLVAQNNFDDIFNELSQYLNEVNTRLAQESLIVIGDLGRRFPNRIPAILSLFLTLIKEERTHLFENIIVAIRTMLPCSPEAESTSEARQFFMALHLLSEHVQSEKAKTDLAWVLGRYCFLIEPAPYLLEKFIAMLDDKKPVSEELLHMMVNSALQQFFKRPAETLPVLSRLFSFVFKNEKANCIVAYKCGMYYQLLQKDLPALQDLINSYFRQIPKPAPEKYIFSISRFEKMELIYNLAPESFTKPLNYFLKFRNQEFNDSEGQKNEVEIDEDEKDEHSETIEPQKPATSSQKANDNFDLLGDDFTATVTTQPSKPPADDFDIFGEVIQTAKAQPIKKIKANFVYEDIDPNDFQQAWIEIEETVNFETELRKDMDDKDILTDLLESENITCIASMQDRDQKKYYFYSKDAVTREFAYMEAIIVEDSTFSVTIKCEKKDVSEALLDLLKTALKKKNYL